jgi:hypothetical protein
MSISVMASVWDESSLSGTELLLLLAIADFADERGIAYPSVATLARKIRMSDRNVRYLLTNLVESGELEIDRNAGPKGCNLFRVKWASGVKSISGVKPIAVGGEAHSRKGVKPTSPEPSLNHHEPSVKRARAARLPADWSPSETDLQFCRTKRPDLDAVDLADRFRDYWCAVPDAKGMKVDWAATWRNWVRNQKGGPEGTIGQPAKKDWQ